MGALMRDPMVVMTFAFVVVVAGGMREELQRGFQLHRLTGHVCGPVPALLLASLAFGAGHTVQGYDVAVATGVLGAFWGLLFLTRRSVVASGGEPWALQPEPGGGGVDDRRPVDRTDDAAGALRRRGERYSHRLSSLPNRDGWSANLRIALTSRMAACGPQAAGPLVSCPT